MAFKSMISSARSLVWKSTRQSVGCNQTYAEVLGTRHFSSAVAPIATYEEIKNLPKNPQVLLIDVREPQELKDTGIVPTSINIPLGQVKDKLSSEFSNEEFKKLFKREKPSSTTELIFMCKIGVRSQKAADLAKTLGYEKSRNFLGSWTEWSEREGSVKN